MSYLIKAMVHSEDIPQADPLSEPDTYYVKRYFRHPWYSIWISCLRNTTDLLGRVPKIRGGR